MARVVDCHVHINPFHMAREEYLRVIFAKRSEWFKREIIELSKDPRKLVQKLDRGGIDRVALINHVSPDVSGYTEKVNDYVAEYCRNFHDRLIPVGSIHPRLCHDPGAEMERLICRLEIKALKLHPVHQHFYPHDYLEGKLKSLEVIYSKCQDYSIPLMVHTGSSAFPGARVRYGDCLGLDDVATDFPRLTIIMCHGGRPIWMDTAFFIVRRHANVLLDVSGIPPKNLLNYFPKIDQIAEKTLFGSDWPGPGVPGIAENVHQLRALPLTEQVKDRILCGTAEERLDW